MLVEHQAGRVHIGRLAEAVQDLLGQAPAGQETGDGHRGVRGALPSGVAQVGADDTEPIGEQTRHRLGQHSGLARKRTERFHVQGTDGLAVHEDGHADL